ncbi:MATE family efflux transporter [Clostridium sp. HBUAS56017]|uniref:MATE family efflux transporter n=1 Tax=Clostridium sp. HBUAS56017 TaxID=2571128 RepID=UPI0011778CF1|nr:MATE family efflux transporter [Clostridium sp. HBUAS56017]
MKKIDLTEGKVMSVLTALALPIMGSSLVQFTYNLVDMFWVGGIGSDAVASVGSSSFYIGLGYSINSLVIIGAGIKIAHAVGRKNEEEAKGYINAGLVINLIIGLLYALVLIFLGKNFIEFLNMNNPTVERDSYLYLAVNGPILLFSFFNMLYARIMGSYGNNHYAFNINLVGLIANIILDPFFIYTLKFGVVGAAVATLAANIIMFIIYKVKFKETLKYNFELRLDYKKIVEIIKLGFPMSCQRVLFTLINIGLARITATFGSNAIAAQKLGLEIESVTYMVIGGLNGAISSFTGQNFGAKKYNRIIAGYNTALKIGITYSFIMALLFIFWGEDLVKLFIRDTETIAIAKRYLFVIAFSEIFSTMEMVSNGIFTGLGLPKIPSIISIVFTALRLPMALIFTNFIGLDGIWLSITLSSVLKGSVSYLVYRIKIRKDYKYVKEN